jgi:hypothetical protein
MASKFLKGEELERIVYVGGSNFEVKEEPAETG